jgi:hypothetical protein
LKSSLFPYKETKCEKLELEFGIPRVIHFFDGNTQIKGGQKALPVLLAGVNIFVGGVEG